MEEAHKIVKTAVTEWFIFFSDLNKNDVNKFDANEYFQVIDEADIQESPVKPNKKLLILIGIVLGFIFAFGYVVLLYRKKYGL